MKLTVTYQEPEKEVDGVTVKPFSVSVTGDRVAKTLPRNHPDWVAWGIDELEELGLILPYVEYVEVEKTNEEIIRENRENAKITRDLAIEAPITVDGARYQVDVVKDEPRITRAIRALEYNGDPDLTTEWILEDNTFKNVTKADLEKVLFSKALREKDIFSEYRLWSTTDMTVPFVIDKNKEY